MRRLAPLFAVLLCVAGCGSTAPSPRSVPQPAATTPPVGLGCMGSCIHTVNPTGSLAPPPTAAAKRQRIPDVSEYQPCVTGHTPTVIRLYEAGTGQEDNRAACNAERLHAWHQWMAGYSFLRPGSCVSEADWTHVIVHSVHGVDLVVADAEVPLPAGFVKCFLRRIQHDLPGTPTGTYTSCGTVSEVVLPLWVANYGVQWPCSPFGNPFKAWQFSDGTFCGEAFVTDCSLNFGITRLHPVHSKPKRRPPAVKHRLIAHWRAERKTVLHRYHLDGCRGNSTGPKCTALRAREHVLWADLRRLGA